MKKYYFAGSIRAGRSDVPTYRRIIDHLQTTGDVLTEHVGDYSLSLKGQTEHTDKFIHDRDLGWLRTCKCVVAETTNPSLGVGYEIACALNWNIPVIALHRPERSSLSAMIAGADGVEVIEYDDLDAALRELDSALERVTK
ncbi:nucleoside 2-deoxyribosyltransferase [Paenarthrobacter sp. NyZ202]|uniref:nucleoside 2-deoxyribosyltransferase n=1 Tax=Paenarthrobacter sp. NyZ202 TaxID=3402689 RepID=UPI003CE9BE62